MIRFVVTMIAGGLMVSGLYAENRVNQRYDNQQDRIRAGEKNGSLTNGEANRLEQREGGLKQEVKTERAANGGHLTGSERRQVNRQQNRLSNRIHTDKHNRRGQ